MSRYANLVTSPLMESIEVYIQENELAAGEALPPERAFCQMLGVSRMTLRAAIAKLCDYGVLDNIQGKGTFVARPRITRDLTGFRAPAEESYHLLGFTRMRAGSTVGNRLKLSAQSEVYEIRRVRLYLGEVLSYETSYIPVQRLKSLDLVKAERYPMAMLYGGLSSDRLTQGNIRISIGQANAAESEALGIPEGTDVVIEKHRVFLDHTPAEYYISVTEAGRIAFKSSLRQE